MKEGAIFSIREILCPLLIIERAALKLIKMFKLINRNGRKIRWNRSRRKCEMRKRIWSKRRDALLHPSVTPESAKRWTNGENQRERELPLVIELNGESLSNLPVNKKNDEQNFPLREHSSP